MKHLNKQNNPNEILSNKEVIITQKLDGAAFSCKKHNGKLYYFGREGKKPIPKEKLMILEIYNNIIEFIETNIEMSDGDYISGELFNDNIKPIIEIIDYPKNELIIFKTNMNLNYLNQFFNINKPIFKGILSDQQIEKLIELSNSSINSTRWTKSILNLLNKNFIPLINKNEIEGIVINTKEENYKIVNPIFTKEIMKKKDISSQTINKEELYKNMKEVIFNQFLNQFNPGNNTKDNIKRFLEELISFLKSLNIEDEEPIGYMKLNGKMLQNYRGLDLSEVYMKVKGTKLETYLWFLFNSIYIPRIKANKYFSKEDNNAINKIREIFGITEEEVKLERKINKIFENRILKYC